MSSHTCPIPVLHRPSRPVFLTAEWRYLAMLSYDIDPDLLDPLVPPGTRLDLWNGRALVTLVAFLFLNPRLHGLPIPFHRCFEELNLRFYVVRPDPDSTLDRRGVVFIREFVPRRAVAALARWRYNESFTFMPMRHRITHDPLSIEYAWRTGRQWCRLNVRTTGHAHAPAPASLEEFIAEHYFACTRHPDGGCIEYHVEHIPWLIHDLDHLALSADFEALYGPRFAPALKAPPACAFLAEGSPVVVHKGTRIC